MKSEITDKTSEIILAMETCVKGGSVSLFRDGKLLDFHIGDKTVSGSEDLLPKIAELLSKNNIKKTEVDLIVVSNGPGSFTGIRIGIATALALQKSLDCKCCGVDMLSAVAKKAGFETKTERIIPVISHGRDNICWFDFETRQLNSVKNQTEYFVSNLQFLINYIAKESENDISIAVCADSGVCAALIGRFKKDNAQNKLKFINVEENLSAILGYTLLNKQTIFEKPKPIYLSQTSFKK